MLIISVDGGGARGALAAAALSRFREAIPRAGLYAGTSAGAIIAGALALGMDSENIYSAFRSIAPRIFKPRPLGGFFYPLYSASRLRKELAGVFGTARLGDLPRPLLVPSLALGSSGSPARAKFTDSLPGSPDLDLSLAEVIARSCQAPGYFAPRDGFADGGLVANNPAACALALALNPARPIAAVPGSVWLLSIGTGEAPRPITGKRQAGLLQWGRDIVPAILNGGGEVADYQARQALGARYYRLNFPLPRPIALDDTKAALAEAYIVRRYCPTGNLAAWLLSAMQAGAYSN